MKDTVTIHVNRVPIRVAAGTSVAAAIMLAGQATCRASVEGWPRGPVCGMGVCGECRVTIDGQRQQRACLVRCTDGMEVWTDA